MSNDEKLGGPPRAESSFWDFRYMAENCKLKEIRSIGNVFSWGGWRDKVWIQCRLDRSFGNDAWFRLFPQAQMEYMDLRASDHRLIMISFALEEEEKGRGRFYFDKRWNIKQGIDEVIKRGWNSDRTDNGAHCAMSFRTFSLEESN
ncbi:hypothetical protein V5N11_002794 [Cardamine amara subsp. amara]|uniref:Uncharacterized protein n=1 Tax=Cardamine amara subsp. amara TaxID=228776 RepID=A0ABD1C6C2_CARAN